MSPNGLVTLVFQLFTGSISDMECVIRSGFLELKLEENDAVMTEKGFLIEDLLKKEGVNLNMPPFFRHGTLSKDEVQETKEIASLTPHAESRLQRVKGYHIFHRPVILTLAPLINHI